MKKRILPTILFALVCMLPQVKALDWQDYDDFGDNSLDTKKWEVGYFAGGQDPVVANGRAELKGGSYTGNNPTKLPQDLLPAAQGSTEGNAFLFARQEGMLGIEAEITLPSSGNSVGVGVYITLLDSSPFNSSGIELANLSSSGVTIGNDYVNAAGEDVEETTAASLDTKYRVAMIHSGGTTIFYVDGEKIQEIDQSLTPDYWAVGAYNDNGQPFTAYVDNVRVLTTATDTTSEPTSAPAPSGKPMKTGDTWTLPELSLEMLWVEPGTFEMGSPLSESDRDSDENQHQVTLTKGFFLGKYELTQQQFERVVSSNPNATMSPTSVGDSRPVGADDSQVENFMNLLNAREKESGRLPSGWQYVLPTEAEWEYACRAGTSTAYSWGANITPANANYDNFIGSTKDVGKYPANAWGFHDMHGNVWELVADGKRAYPNTPVTDPVGPLSESNRIYRGGSSARPGSLARSAYRHSDGGWSPGLGVRIALKADEAGTSWPFLTQTSTASYAPDSLIGQVVTHTTGSTVETLRFMDEDTVLFYESAQDANPGQLSYVYAKTSGTEARVTVTFEDGGKETTDYVFTGADTATYVWKELSGDMDTASGTANFTNAVDGEWIAYDDFSNNFLDAGKWEVGYFAGGQDPVVANGRVELKGGSYTGNNPTMLPQDLMPAAQGSTEGNAFLFIKQDGIQGIEAEITLPAVGNSPEAGVFIDMFDSSPLGSSGIELVHRYSSVHFNYDYFNTAGQEVEGEKAAAWDTSYRVAVLHAEGKTTFYVDGEKIQEFDQSFTPDYWGVGAFNDNGDAFTAYVDNVKVLWKVEAPEESVGDSSAPAPVTVTITAATSSSSQGSVAGGGAFTAGATATLTATATAGYLFSHWSGGYSGTENPLSLTVSADATVTANFAQDGRDSDNDGLSNYDEIQRGTDPNDSDTDDDFLTDGLEVDMALNPLVANGSLQEIATAAQAAMTNAREAGRQEVLNNPIAYGFVSGGAPVTNATGNGETPMIEGWFYQEASGWQYVSAQTYPYLYRASPSSWLYFQSGSSNPPLLYDFSEERWLTPPANTHMVKVNANLTEAGSVSGGGTYENGSSATLTATPANGYVFVAWSGDASGESASTTIIVNGSKTVMAIFSKITAADVKEVLDDIFGGF